MPRHETQREPAERISRRSLLQGAATAGAAGLAAAALGGTLSPAAAAATRPAVSPRPTAPGDGDLQAPAGPLVVHVRDAKSGDIELFSGTSQTRLRDRDLAARIVRAIG
jgi:hypothetical protein